MSPALKNSAKRIVFLLPLVRVFFERLNFYRRIVRSDHVRERRRVAQRFLRGQGLEIGALHIAQWLPRGATARYVDFIDEHEARKRYPELRYNRLAHVDIVDDGETLGKIENASVDFIVASHVIEHCENPLGTIQNWLTKLRSGGIVFMVVPDMAGTFDRDRKPTPPDHILHDWKQGSESSRREHYEDYGANVEHLKGAALESYVKDSLAARTNIHFHAWRMEQFVEALLLFGRELSHQNKGNPGFELQLSLVSDAEFLIVLRKS